MYSPTARLLTILELLQSYKQMSGSQLAQRLEVNKRTIRRYIVMLQDMGIPIEAERGPEGAYHLRRGYKLPPLMFTDSEAVALTLGLIVLRAYKLPVDVVAIEGALAKTERVMPEKLLHEAQGLQEAISFNVAPPPTQLQNGFVATLSTATQQRRQVFLRYMAFNNHQSERAFDPYGIVFNQGYWYTTGYCHLRHDLRTFRMDRIVTLNLSEQAFERPPNFDAFQYVMDSIATMPGAYPVEVLMRTTLEQVQRILSPEAGVLESTPEGIVFRRQAYDLTWIAHLLLQCDFPITVRQPPELRQMLRQIAAKALHMLDDRRSIVETDTN